MDPPGGGNAVAAWMLQALADRHQVSTLTVDPWVARVVDDFYGTRLTGSDVTQLHVGAIGSVIAYLPGRLDRLHLALLFRKAAAVAGDFDLCVTADNYGAFTKPGIQYVHYPTPLRPPPTRLAPLVHAYYIGCDAISGLSWNAVRRNLTLSNSSWTAVNLAREHGLRSEVLYPPVGSPGRGMPWQKRSNTFLCIGRFHPCKRIELAVSIVERSRKVLPDATLVIVGSPVDAEYHTRLRTLVNDRPWVTMMEDLSQADVYALIQRARYGIHAMEGEHFGIAAAEMASAGCLVFAHDSGGVVEVIDKQSELVWSSVSDAVYRIAHVASNPDLQRALSARVAAHAKRFSTERFMNEFRGFVARFETA